MSSVPRQRKNESEKNYRERCKLAYKSNHFTAAMDIDKYKSFLDTELLEYVEINIEKKNGCKINMVIPACQFKVMSRADINKLFKA